MRAARPTHVVKAATLLMAICFCVFSVARLYPLHRTRRSYAAVRVALSHNLTRHATQEVSPRNARLLVPYAIGLLPVVTARPHCCPPRISARVQAWPTDTWPILRRISPASADDPKPA
jgi:hypothetical protein